ncbi:hypothetical protein BN135_3239 [Cronobacter muytjensii 530]
MALSAFTGNSVKPVLTPFPAPGRGGMALVPRMVILLPECFNR